MRAESPRPSFLRSLALGATALLVMACPLSLDGFANSSWFWQRQMDWLDYATETPLSPGSVGNVIAHLEREARDVRYSVAPGSIPDDAFDGVFSKMWRLKDTSDFDALRFVDLLYAFRGHPAASEDLWQAIEQAMFDFKYWYTHPTPERCNDMSAPPCPGDRVVDEMWYWSENHILIFKTCEYLMGQLYPDRVFTVTGMTGAEHQAAARPFIEEWLMERARFGFTEWHSNVYYNLDFRPLLSLVEWVEDEDLSRRASMVLDLVLLDIALHLHRGTFGATHGRSYIKDKASATTEDTFDAAKMLFEDTDEPYGSRGSATAASLARAKRYRLPEAIRQIARWDEPMVDRERMNLPLDEEPPLDPATAPEPVAPYGEFPYADFKDRVFPPGEPLPDDDEEYIPFYWSMAAQAVWQILPSSLIVGTREDLFDSQFSAFKDLYDVVWNDDDVQQSIINAQGLATGIWQFINESVLKEVNTYTYRTRHYMMSTAQDYRKGLRGSQTHISQATLSEQAMVFTTHPGITDLPLGPGDPIPPDWNWQREDEPGPGYWTGYGAQPRAAQHENVSVEIYAPLKPSIAGFEYRAETHAYFPVAHFDEVVRSGRWTFGRKDDAYVALYSWRDVSWRGGQPEVFQNGGLDFDLVAEGGPDNVWITECGSVDEWPGGFAAFMAAFDDGLVTITPAAHGFDVDYASPSQGLVEFGWEGDLVVAGDAKPLAGYQRFDNPFVQVDFDTPHYEVSDGKHFLVLDFAEDMADDQREASAPESQSIIANVYAAIVAALLGGGP